MWLTVQDAKVDARQLPCAPAASFAAVLVGPMFEMDRRELDGVGVREAPV